MPTGRQSRRLSVHRFAGMAGAVTLVAAGSSAAAGVSAPMAAPTTPVVAIGAAKTGQELTTRVEVRAWIDGRSTFIFHDETVQWHHDDWDAPGKHDNDGHSTVNWATYVNGFKWHPHWPNRGQNEFCHCDSDEAQILYPPAVESSTIVLHRDPDNRGTVEVVQSPNETNGYTTKVEINDDPPPEAAWYHFSIIFPDMVGLGDEYAAGSGTGQYGTLQCGRSPIAYPPLVSAALQARLDFQACRGAKARTMTHQLPHLSPDIKYVSLSAGLNDAGFSKVLRVCRQGQLSCARAIDAVAEYVDRTLPSVLARLYGAIAQRAYGATVVVAGYPRLFNGQNCGPYMHFTVEALNDINGIIDRIDSVTQETADNQGFLFVDPRQIFTGHAVCDADPWINNFVHGVHPQSFRPNAAGEQICADMVSSAFQ